MRKLSSEATLGKLMVAIAILTLILGSIFNPLAAIAAAIIWLFGLDLLASDRPRVFGSSFLNYRCHVCYASSF